MKNQEKAQLEENQKLEGKTKDLKEKTSKKLTKATENQISIQFESSFSNLIKDEKKGIDEQKDINKFLGDQQVKARVYFIRHGESIEDDGKGGLQSSGAKLSEHGRENLEKVAVEVREKCLNNKNAYLLSYNGGKEEIKRVKESCNIINQELGLEETRIDNNVIGLHTTDKSEPNQTKRMGDISAEIGAFCKELSGKLKGKENINIVCVMHKSNIGYIKSYFFKKDGEAVSLSHDGMTPGEIREVDFTLEGKALNYVVNKTILSINSEDCYVLLGALEEKVLKAYVNRFRAGKLQIWELQNLVNMYFQKNPKLFEGCLLSENRDLRIFCISNLLVEGKFDVVDEKMKGLLEMEKEGEIVDFVDSVLSVCTEKERKELLKIIVKKRSVLSGLNLGKLEYYANYEKYVKKNIRKIRKRTLDEKLRNGEKVILPLGFKGGKHDTIEELLNTENIIILEGEAGAGKSTKFLEIMEYLKPQTDKENKYFPVYINLGDISFDDLDEKIEIQIGNLHGEGKYKFVYLFDALDESKYDNNTKKKLFEKIYKLQQEGQVIITSRPGNLPIFTDNEEEKQARQRFEIQTIVYLLKSFDIEQIELYIFQHLSEEKKKIWEEWKKEKGFIKDIENNPLMLSIICGLIEDGTQEELGLLNSKSDLYEKIIEKRLLDWEMPKGRDAMKEFRKRKIFLSEIAYKSIFLGEKINEGFLDVIIDSKEDFRLSVSKANKKGKLIIDYDCLNMIYRNNKEGEFLFVHESFREYFAVSHIIENIKKGKFDYEIFLIKDIKKVDLNFLEFLTDILNKEENKKIKNDFLSNILLNQDYYPEGIHEKIVFLLGRINRSEMLKYLDNIYLNEGVINVLGKLGGKENVDYIKSLKTNLSFNAIDGIIKTLGRLGGDKNIDYIKGYKNHPNFYFLITIIEVLGKLGGDKDIKFIKSYKDYGEEDVEQYVIKTLGKIGTKDCIECIKTYKNHHFFGTRRKMILVLWRLGGEENIRFLRSLKNDSDKELVDSAISSLGEILGKNNKDLIKDIKNVSKNHMMEASRSILDDRPLCGKYISKIDFFIPKLESSETITMLELLGKLGGKENIEFIKSYKNHSTASVKKKSLQILLEIGREKDVEYIENFKIDTEPSLIKTIIEILGGIGGEENIKFLRSFKNNSEELIDIYSIIEALGKVGGKENIETMRYFLNHSDKDNIPYIIGKLGEIGGDKNMKIIKEFINTSDTGLIIFLIECYLVMWWEDRDILYLFLDKGLEKNEKIMKHLLNHSNIEVIKNIINFLGETGGKENIEFIKRYKDHLDIGVVTTLIEVLSKLGKEEVLDIVRGYINHPDTGFVIEVINILWKYGGEKNIDAIRLFKAHSDIEIRIETLINSILFKRHNYESINLKFFNLLLNIRGEINHKVLRIIRNGGDIDKIKALIEILGEIGGEKNIEIIKTFHNYPDISIILTIIDTLGNVTGENIIKTIGEFQNNLEEGVIIELIEILGEIGGEKNIDAIKLFKNHESPGVIKEIIWALGEAGGEDNMKIIRSYKKHHAPEVIIEMICSLHYNFREENIEFIREFKSYLDITGQEELEDIFEQY